MGCTAQGTRAPDNAEAFQLNWWNARDGATVQSDMTAYFNLASAGVAGFAEKCWGTGVPV